MHTGQIVFAQLMEHIPHYSFRRIVRRYDGERRLREFSCWDQFACMAFGQLTFRESLRDLEICLRSRPEQLYHMGIRGRVSRSTLAEANERRDWRIYADLAAVLIRRARQLYAQDRFAVELDATAYALDASTIDLCLSLFPWARFRRTKAAIKLNTLLDLRGSIPSLISITEGKRHEVNWLDELLFEAGSFYIMDRGYLDFRRLHRLHRAGAFFVIRAKERMRKSADSILTPSSQPRAFAATRPSRSPVSTAPPTTPTKYAASASTTSNKNGRWCFSPTTSPCLQPPSRLSTKVAGRSNSS